MESDPLTYEIIGAAIAVSKGTRTGLLEAPYETFLAHELVKRGFAIERQTAFPWSMMVSVWPLRSVPTW
jgi:GxxExxY protein